MKKPNRELHVRLKAADLQQLEAVCRKLDLDKSQIARRALRLGLASFQDAKLPGGNSEQQEITAS